MFRVYRCRDKNSRSVAKPGRCGSRPLIRAIRFPDEWRGDRRRSFLSTRNASLRFQDAGWLGFPKSQNLPDERDVGQILWAPECLLALQDRFQRQYRHVHSLPPDSYGSAECRIKTADAVNPWQKIHQCIILECGHCWSQHGSAKPDDDCCQTHKPSLGELNPNIRIEGCCRHALKNRRRHPCYLKPYAFLAEDVNKPCERRNPSCRSHRSSGFALRLIANKILSSGDRSGNFPSLRCSASNFFLFIDETLPPACDEGNPTPDPLIRAYAQ